MPDNLILSEVNPLDSVVSVPQQAQQWLNLLGEEELDSFNHQPYGQQILLLAKKAKESKQHLIIRDWVAANFIHNPSQENILTPSFFLEQTLYLTHYGLTPLSVAIARRAAGVYESITRTFPYLQLDVQSFGEGYVTYAEAVKDYAIFHYETLCQDPQSQIRLICETLDINYDADFIHKFYEFDRCTGDNDLEKSSRGGQIKEIKLFPSPLESQSYIEAQNDENCRRADQLLGYE